MTHPENGQESTATLFTRDFLLLATINLAMFFGFQMLSIGMPVYVAQLGAPDSLVGLVTTTVTISAIIVRIFSGAILDRFGRAGMLIGGIVLMVCMIIAFAIFPIVGVILGLRLLHGVGWGFGSTAASTIAADIIPKKRFAEGMGYFAMTTAIASALAPALSVALVQGPGGAYMLAVAAGVTVLALILSIIQTILRRKPKTDAPADAPAPAVKPPAAASKFDTLFERRAFVPSALMLLVNVSFGCITTFIALHAQGQGVNSIVPYFIVYAIVTLVSRPAIGKLIDRYGFRMPAILSTLCTVATLVLIAFSTNVVMFALAGVLAGLGIGTAMGTFQTMAVADVEPWRRGVATSTYFTAFDLGIAIGAFAGGLVANAFSYSVMFVAVAVFPLIASILSAARIKSGR